MSESENEKVPSNRDQIRNPRNKVIQLDCDEPKTIPGKRSIYTLYLFKSKSKTVYKCEDENKKYHFKLLKKIPIIKKKIKSEESQGEA
tara:strand:- start:554 stop:817 length:264 start_codon:yes stop_codon:yes gene_type:complete